MRWRALAAFASSAVPLAGCGSGNKPSIVLYNGQHPELTTAMVSAFQRASGIAVGDRTNDGVVLADQILEEGGSSPADVYLTENSPELVDLSEHGLLARLPSSILDLAEPKWKGKVAIAPLDSDFPPVVGAVIATHGRKAAASWLAGLKRNGAIYQDEESVVAAVNRGDAAVGVINQYYWYRLRREIGASAIHSALYYFPHGDAGSVVNVSGAAVLASSHSRGKAERFVAFLVSRAGQRLISQGDDYEYPVRPGVAPNPQLPAFAQIPHAAISVTALGNDRPAREMIIQAGFGS